MTSLNPMKGLSFNKDKVFQKVFSSVPVFTILFEDPYIEDEFFGVNDKSAILTVTGAGCGVAGHLSKNPERIDAVDSNSHHLALTALKIEAARKLSNHEDLYTLFGHGKHSGAKQLITELTSDLPLWMQKYWSRRYKVFEKGLYHTGVFHHFVQRTNKLVGLDRKFLKQLIHLPVEERVEVGLKKCNQILNRPFVTTVVNSPLVLLANGINFRQRDKNLESSNTSSMKGVFLDLITNFCRNDMERNWVLWHIMAGHFNHEHPECRPPYLTKDSHDRSYGAKTEVNYHQTSFVEVLQQAPREHWSHYSFSDAMDWMPEELQRKVFELVIKTSRPGAVLINRTVEKECLIDKLKLHKNFQRMDKESDEATAKERSRLYKRTDFYRIVP